MNAEIISAQYVLQTDWFLNALKDVSDEESEAVAEDYANPVKWIAGHLLSCRMTVIELLTGTNPDSRYQTLFGKGTKWTAGNDYPTIEDLKQQWMMAADELIGILRNVSVEKWQAKAPFQTSIPDSSFGGLVAFFAMHESFHIGQLSLLRKALGKPAMHMGRMVQ